MDVKGMVNILAGVMCAIALAFYFIARLTFSALGITEIFRNREEVLRQRNSQHDFWAVAAGLCAVISAVIYLMTS